jgi:hypothetical protein
VTQTTAAPIAAGRQPTFTLSGGGSPGIVAVPGFQGHIIARTEFRYCHGFAMLSAFNALANSSGQHRAYLVLVMDRPVHRESVPLPRTSDAKAKHLSSTT